ncbi:MAG: HEPN domain-containing protein [Candidatus Methanodesulfokora sp.]
MSPLRPADPKVERVALSFLSEVRRILGDGVLAVVAFGSRVWGGYREGSDYDLILLHRTDEKRAEEAAAEAALKISAELGIGVEPIVLSMSEFRGDGYLVEKCRKDGFFVYPDGGEKEARRRESLDILMLAEEFLDIAKLLMGNKKYRGAVDEAYNAAELAVKALMLWDGHDIPGSHGGIVGEFGRLYVLTGRIENRLGRLLSLSLERRNRARYGARADIGEEDAKAVVELAEELIEHVKDLFKSCRPEERKLK